MANEETRLTVLLEARTTQLERAFERASRSSGNSWRRIEADAKTSATRLERVYAGVGRSVGSQFASIGRTAAAGFVGAFGAREIAQAASQYTNLTNTLKVTGLEGNALSGTLQQLFQIAQRNGTALDPLVTLYSRLSQSQQELGASSADLLKFTDGISVALRVGGTTAEQASGALLQLSQALGGSVVRAEEFNSVNEGARPILQAVANGLLEAGGSVSKLRTLVVDGKVSSEAFFRAFLAGMGGLSEQASRATGTVDQGLTQLGNSFVMLVGHLDDMSGASRAAATNLNSVASVIERLPGLLDRAGGYLRSFRGWLADVGNSSAWEKIGRFLGGDYSPEGMRRAGIYDPSKTGGGIGSDRVAAGDTGPVSVTVSKPISIKDAPVDGSGDKTKKVRENEYQRLTQAIQQRTDAMQAETAAQASLNPLIEDYGFAVERARAQHDLLTAAHEAGLTITPELERQIEGLATAYANASVTAAQLSESQQRAQQVAAEFNSLGRDVFGGFISDMQRGVTGAQALTNALGKVADKLIEIGLNALFSPAGSGAGGLFGIIGQALGFSAGGYTGLGGVHEPAGVVHKGEVVWSQRDVRRAGGVDVVEAMRRGARGYSSGGIVRAPSLPAAPAIRRAAGAANVRQQISFSPKIDVRVEGGSRGEAADAAFAGRIGQEIENRMRAVVVDELMTQMRPGNLLG